MSIEDALSLVVEVAKREEVTLTKTRLVKLMYFLDLRSWEESGRVVTGVEWIWHHYGPYSWTLEECVDRMARNDELTVTARAMPAGYREFRISGSRRLGYYADPDPSAERLVRTLVREFKTFSAKRIGDASYETEPMRQLISSGGSRGDVIEFPAPVPTAQQVQSALARYQGISVSEDVGDLDDLRDELEEFATTRRAASTKLLG